MSGTCLAVAAALTAAGAQECRRVRHVLVVSLIAVTTVLVVTAGGRGDAILRAFGYPWSALFAALYLSRRAAHAYAATASVGFAAGITIPGRPHMVSAWILVTVTVVTVTAVTSGLVQALRMQSETDHLTAIANRTGFDRLAGHAIAAAARRQEVSTVVVCDIDGLKQLNDHQGHAAGDAMLAAVATAWKATLRAGDVFARLGGDEFAIVLPGTDTAGAEATVERLRCATSAPFSAGIAVCSPGEPLDAVLSRADAAMYVSKNSRRRGPGPSAAVRTAVRAAAAPHGATG